MKMVPWAYGNTNTIALPVLHYKYSSVCRSFSWLLNCLNISYAPILGYKTPQSLNFIKTFILLTLVSFACQINIFDHKLNLLEVISLRAHVKMLQQRTTIQWLIQGIYISLRSQPEMCSPRLVKLLCHILNRGLPCISWFKLAWVQFSLSPSQD